MTSTNSLVLLSVSVGDSENLIVLYSVSTGESPAQATMDKLRDRLAAFSDREKISVQLLAQPKEDYLGLKNVLGSQTDERSKAEMGDAKSNDQLMRAVDILHKDLNDFADQEDISIELIGKPQEDYLGLTPKHCQDDAGETARPRNDSPPLDNDAISLIDY